MAHAGSVDVLGTLVPLLEGSAGPGPVTALVRPESVRIMPEESCDARVARGELPGCSLPRPGAAGERDPRRGPGIRNRGRPARLRHSRPSERAAGAGVRHGRLIQRDSDRRGHPIDRSLTVPRVAPHYQGVTEASMRAPTIEEITVRLERVVQLAPSPNPSPGSPRTSPLVNASGHVSRSPVPSRRPARRHAAVAHAHD